MINYFYKINKETNEIKIFNINKNIIFDLINFVKTIFNNFDIR